MAPIAQLLSLPFAYLYPSKSAPYSHLPRTGSVWGDGPNTTLSYYYPLSPSTAVHKAFSTGSWPRDRAAVPKTIYECDPPASRGFEARMYTCWNEEIDLGAVEKVIVVHGADVKELAPPLSESGGKMAGAPEKIRDWQLARAEESPKCDGRTGLAIDVLHWGAWQHNCFHGVSEWAVKAREARKGVLKERAERGYEMNVKIRKMWEEKNGDLKKMEGESWRWVGGELEKKMGEREVRFWKESFLVREEGREVDGGVEEKFGKKMKGEEKEKEVKAPVNGEKAPVKEGEKSDQKAPAQNPEKDKVPEKGKEPKNPKETTDPKASAKGNKKPQNKAKAKDQAAGAKTKKVKVKIKGKGGDMKVTVKVNGGN